MTFRPTVSIIILTYNNLPMTRQCLESIETQTDQPEYELILVDNASNDGTQNYLQEFAATRPNVRLILNETNQGFAFGNNQGVLASHGEYVVLLNNDTIVTDGWLAGLLRPLQDEQIGMVGPVTNAIGNQARISVDYSRLDDMPEFARRYTESHQGSIFDISMLALFCVALRRAVYDEIGPLDERFELGMFEDDDYALRLRANGYRIVCTEEVFIHHWGSAGFSAIGFSTYWQVFTTNLRRFEEKWQVRWQPSPFREELLGHQLRSMVDDKIQLYRTVLDREQRIMELEHENARLRTMLNDAFSSQGWKLLTSLRRIRAQYFPIDSRRDKFLRASGSLILRAGQFLGRILKRFGIGRKEGEQPAKTLARIMADHPDVKGVVVIVPSIPWDVPLFQRPHQLALALARLGYLVFFSETVYGGFIEFKPVAENAYRLSNIDLEIFKTIPAPFVFTLAYNTSFLAHFQDPCVIYEYIDELNVFDGDLSELQKNHDQMVRSADVVIATAEVLYQRLRSQRKDALLSPNGVDSFFIRNKIEETEGPPEDIQKLVQQKKPIIGYYGALAKWFDYDLLAHSAKARPGYTFMLIGPDYDGSYQHSRLQECPNVHWLGVKPYAILPGYLKYFDVATIPFILDEITHSTSPLKLFEYMSGQKPIVTTAMKECKKYPVVLIAENPADYVSKLDQALALRADSNYLQQLLNTAQENTWDVRASQIMNAAATICAAKSQGQRLE